MKYCDTHQELEPILPLGEVSMNGAEVKKVGVILSLVEADGTIVVQGESPPLDEGCVLSSSVVELQEDVRKSKERADVGGGGGKGREAHALSWCVCWVLNRRRSESR